MIERCSFYNHDVCTDPGCWASDVAELQGSLPALVKSVQGLLIHDYYGGVLYTETPPGFETASRLTLTAGERLAAIKSIDPSRLDQQRPPAKRSVGTCRDYSLLLCAFLRQHDFAARVRCGFAGYFQPGFFEDHWICEVWHQERHRWRIVDAQIDEEHRNALSIGFSSLDIPWSDFLTADRAWQRVRAGEMNVDRIGKGTITGLWFVLVNLIRDFLSLQGMVTSRWDGWRDLPQTFRTLDEHTLLIADRIAAWSSTVDNSDGHMAPPADAMTYAATVPLDD